MAKWRDKPNRRGLGPPSESRRESGGGIGQYPPGVGARGSVSVYPWIYGAHGPTDSYGPDTRLRPPFVHRSWWKRARDEILSWLGNGAAAERREIERPRGRHSDKSIEREVNDHLARNPTLPT